MFQSFLPLLNPLGFGVADFVELALAALLAVLYLAGPFVEPHLRRLASHTAWSMLVLAILPIALRLAVLPHCPVPTPSGSDDFSHLLVADTLTHFHLANPSHLFHQFFEAIYILQQPSYSSMYPPGQGLVLAFGKLFGTPWAGVLLCDGALCALCYWMLRGWIDPLWAFAGGLLAVFQFGPLSQWMNTYWTSAIPAVAGCLVFGALPRLRATTTHVMGLGALAGAGLALHLITRPFETILLSISAAFFLPLLPWRTVVRAATAAVLVLIPAVMLLLFQNRAVTGSWTTLPYQLSRYEYGIPATFVMQPEPVPHRPLTPEQDLDYRAQVAIHDEQPGYFERFFYRLRYYRFFIPPPLYLAVAVFLLAIREWRYVWVLAAIVVFALGTNFYPYFYPHYAGATTSLFILMAIAGLRSSVQPGRLLILLTTAIFLCWYGIALSGQEDLVPALAYDQWNFINHGDPEGRIAINNQLEKAPGKQLVFVHYAPSHKFHEWIHNDADIDAARVVWALDLGEEENKKLIAYYPDRQVWIVEPDAQPPTLRTLIY